MVDADSEPTDDSERIHSYVIFQLGGEGYAMEVTRVREVLDARTLTTVPGGPRSLRGVLNLRGHVVPVYDLRIPFELPIEASPARAPSILMVESNTGNEPHVTGLLVDRVFDVLEFAPEKIQPAPRLGLGRSTPFVRGLIRHKDGFLLVLDLDHLFMALGSLREAGGSGAGRELGGEGF